jgi:inner membrane protease subunit 2
MYGSKVSSNTIPTTYYKHLSFTGDERHHSDDSNLFGPVPVSLINSKLAFIIWPMDRVGPIGQPAVSKNSERNGPMWRREMAALEQESWRRSRVVPAEGATS